MIALLLTLVLYHAETQNQCLRMVWRSMEGAYLTEAEAKRANPLRIYRQCLKRAPGWRPPWQEAT